MTALFPELAPRFPTGTAVSARLFDLPAVPSCPACGADQHPARATCPGAGAALALFDEVRTSGRCPDCSGHAFPTDDTYACGRSRSDRTARCGIFPHGMHTQPEGETTP